MVLKIFIQLCIPSEMIQFEFWLDPNENVRLSVYMYVNRSMSVNQYLAKLLRIQFWNFANSFVSHQRRSILNIRPILTNNVHLSFCMYVNHRMSVNLFLTKLLKIQFWDSSYSFIYHLRCSSSNLGPIRPKMPVCSIYRGLLQRTPPRILCSDSKF